MLQALFTPEKRLRARARIKNQLPLRPSLLNVPRVSVRFTILGSGSSGNCAYLEAGETRLLIDAGLSGRQTRQRLATLGRAPEGLHGILITHEHSDHIIGLVALAAKLHVPIYCNRLTAEAIEETTATKFDFRIFTTGASFEVNDVGIETFAIPHDAMDPVGFLLRTSDGNLGFLTDLGHATRLTIERVRPANVLVLETNHDVKLLQDDTRRPWSLKQRILGRHGHLSNEAGAAVIEQVASDHLHHVFLGHLSRDCNRPELALRAVSGVLQKTNATHIAITVASQDVPCPTIELRARVSATEAVPAAN